jgi:sigma-B regulation protein RsbU (phosphoserine phosphatase)
MMALRARPPADVPLSASGASWAELITLVGELNAALDPLELFRALGPLLRRVLDHHGLALYLPQPDDRLLRVHAEGTGAPPEWVTPGQGQLGRAAAERTPHGQGDAFALPLVHGDRLVGVLELRAPARDLAAARDTLAVLAPPLAVALSNAARHREARWYAGLLATLYDIGKETASILELDELLARVAEVVKRVIDYEMFGILLVDEDSGDLVLRQSVSYGSIPERTRIRMGEGLSGTAALTKQPILVGDVSSDPRYLNLIPHTRSELVVPLLHKDTLVGVFDLESTVLNRFTEEHLKVLTPLAGQVAGAIANARLVDELVEHKERLDRELAIARRVQHGLFPEECPSGPGWEAASSFLPARELGGDLYDFYDLEEGVLGLAVGDVSGKGVPAALYGAFASGTVRSRAFERLTPANLLYRVNRTLRRRGVEGLYCTLAYAVFDFRAGELRLGNSGLPYPLRYSSESGRCQPIEVAGVPLGALDGSTYEDRALKLHPGDVFVFYSDGVSEASRGGEDYGSERLRRVVEQQAAGSVSSIGDAIAEDLHAFLGDEEPSDDVTIVVVKVRT